jgi:type II secretory pathway component PulJ
MAMAVGGIIMAGATATIHQVVSNNSRNAAHMMAVKQVENALHFMVRDVQMAQRIQTTGLPVGQVLRLTWVTWDGAVSNNVTYAWDSIRHTLTRTRSDGNVTTTVAYSIDPQPTFSVAGANLTVDLTATVQDARESRRVKIVARPSSQ